MKAILQRTLIVFFGFCAAGLVCECGFYTANHCANNQSLRRKVMHTDELGESTDFFDYHPIYGHNPLPNINFPPFGITTNSVGFRATEEISISKPANTLRIVASGDSQVWGYALDDEKLITTYLKNKLNIQSPSTEIQTLNLGVSGFDVGQSLLKFIVEGAVFEPDAVLLVIFPENDFAQTTMRRSSNIEKPRFLVRDYSLCVSNIPPEKAPGWPSNTLLSSFTDLGVHSYSQNSSTLWGIVAQSETVKFFRHRHLRFIQAGLDPDIKTFDLFNSLNLSPMSQQLWKALIPCYDRNTPPDGPTEDIKIIMGKQLRAFARASQTVHAKFIVAIKPFENDYRQGVVSRDYLTFLSLAYASGAEVIDLFGVAEDRSIRHSDLFIQYSHLSALGNEIIAEEAARLLIPQIFPVTH